jgi:hypothetical protein
MLTRLIYVSTASDGVDLNECKQILIQAHARNTNEDLTGLLAFNNQKFLQVLEGSRESISALYSKLLTDPRHRKLEVMGCKEIQERLWPKWSMGFAVANTTNRALFLKHSMRSEFNPYIMTFEAAEKLLLAMSESTIETPKDNPIHSSSPSTNFFTKSISQ